MTEPSLDDPEYRRRVVKACVVVSPFAFVGTYLLGWVQGASPALALLLGAIMLVGCLAAAGLFNLRGSAAGGDAAWVMFILKMFARR